jgi:GNAT superfamily N-acetyltransferase
MESSTPEKQIPRGEEMVKQNSPHSQNLEEMLKAYPKEVILTDGTGVTLRPLGAGDEAALSAMFQRFPPQELWFLNHDVRDDRVIRSWVRHSNLHRVISIAAALEGRIVANAVLLRTSRGARRHMGEVRVFVDPAFRGKRLATWMLLDLINLGISMGLQMLVMGLIQDSDAPIINSVRKLGFSEAAVLEGHLLDQQNKCHNLVIMRKGLALHWPSETA